MKRHSILSIPFLLSMFLLISTGCPQTKTSTETGNVEKHTLRNELSNYIQSKRAHIGLSLIDIESGDTLNINDSRKYPMQSVYKFPLAVAILKLSEEGKFKLSDKIKIKKEDLHPDSWSPLREKYPDGNIELSILELIEYTVAQSDNNTCDLLFRLAGGPAEVQKIIAKMGYTGISIANTEFEMSKAWHIQYDNWAHPSTISNLLLNLERGKLLSETSTGILLRIMTESQNSKMRIKGLLPANTPLAHKTGSSGDNDTGLTAACNDAGIITMPDGKKLALCVFVSESKETYDTLQSYIAHLAKIVFDHYLHDAGLTLSVDSVLLSDSDRAFNGVVLLARGNAIIYNRAYGYSDIAVKTLLKTDDRFVVGSLSKQFTAVMVLRACDKGLLKTDIPIVNYLPELKQEWAQTVTIEHLLSHTHGISDRNKVSQFKAGSEFQYSQLGYELLSEILERKTGKSFAELSDSLFAACGMKHTLHPSGSSEYPPVISYLAANDGRTTPEKNPLENHPAAGSFISTAGDLLIWNKLLHHGKLLKPATYKKMCSAYPNAIRDHTVFGMTKYGYGITVWHKNDKPYYVISGYAPGFASINIYFPGSDMSLIVLQNTAVKDDLKASFYFHKALADLLIAKN